MAKGLTASIQHKLDLRDNLINLIVREIAASRGIALTNELPPLKSHADYVKAAGGRSLAVASL